MRQQREYDYSLEQVIKSDKKWLSDVEADYQDWDKHRNSSYKSWRVEIIKSLQSPFLRERNKKVGEGAGKAMLQSGEEGHRMFGPDASSTYIFPKELEQNPDALYPWVRSFIQDRIEYLESLQAQGYR